MKVFISWSGEQSRQIAVALRDWLPTIFESVTPYMSARDNEAGARWNSVVSQNLDESDFGILCLTPGNLQAPWLNFEAGALSKSVDTARVVPLLFNLAPTDVASPLSQFMMKQSDEEGIRDVVTTINSALTSPRAEQALKTVFQALWPVLHEQLRKIQAPQPDPVLKREDRELLEEILQLLREREYGYPILDRLSKSSAALLRSLAGEDGDVYELGDRLVIAVPQERLGILPDKLTALQRFFPVPVVAVAQDAPRIDR